jgi:hypothetical protein
MEVVVATGRDLALRLDLPLLGGNEDERPRLVFDEYSGLSNARRPLCRLACAGLALVRDLRGAGGNYWLATTRWPAPAESLYRGLYRCNGLRHGQRPQCRVRLLRHSVQNLALCRAGHGCRLVDRGMHLVEKVTFYFLTKVITHSR